jgi:hypothetical protein
MTFGEEVDHWAKLIGALTPKQRNALVALLKALKEGQVMKHIAEREQEGPAEGFFLRARLLVDEFHQRVR